MGSELCLLTLDWKCGNGKDNAKGAEAGFQKRCAEIDKNIDKIKRMPDKRLMEDVSGGKWMVAEVKGVVMDDDGNVIGLDEYKQYLYDLVDTVRAGWSSRQATIFMVGGKYWVFATGGETWGDSPGETFDALSYLYQAGVV